MKSLFLSAAIILIVANTFFGQSPEADGINEIKSLVEKNDIPAAEKAISSQIEALTSLSNFDSLAHYIYYAGKIEILKNPENKSISRAFKLSEQIESNSSQHKTLYLLNAALADLHHDMLDTPTAFEYAEKSSEYAKKSEVEEYQANAAYQMADFAMRLGDFGGLEKNIRRANQIIEGSPNEKFNIAPKVHNLLGAVLYFSSESDSALVFYNKALAEVKTLESIPENKYYLPSTILGNMVMLHQYNNDFSEAMSCITESINLQQKFLSETTNHPLEDKAKRNILIAYRNLSSLYNDIGDRDKAHRVAELSYDFSHANFDKHSEEHFGAVTLMAETSMGIHEYKQAQEYLAEAEECLSGFTYENYQILSNFHNIKGRAYYLSGDLETSRVAFETGDEFTEKMHPGIYSRDRMYLLLNLAICYSDLNQKEKALGIIDRVQKEYFESDENSHYMLNAFYRNKARINLDHGAYEECLLWCEQSEGLTKTDHLSDDSELNAIQYNIDRSEILMIQAKAKYYLLQQPTEIELLNIKEDINQALDILNQRKSIISSVVGINNIVENGREIFDFAKRLNYDLYSLTNDDKYLEQMVTLNESSLYSKIRARLNANESINFRGLPADVSQKENELKSRLNESFDPETPNTEDLKIFIENNNEWLSFLDTLKSEHQEYYQMRYASIEQSLNIFAADLPKNTTIIRYFYIEEQLFGLVINEKNKKVIPLQGENLIPLIESVHSFQKPEGETVIQLHQIYKNIWAPLEKEILGKYVVIIPDQELFNLSFETLSPKPIKTYEELKETCLLNKHVISYNYSLFLITPSTSGDKFNENYIGFVPEFTDEMKANYNNSVSDSISWDPTYSRLLPQPFASDLAIETSKKYQGKSFIREESTEENFKNKAGNHKILFIGTHAEANNASPQMSRFIFAKNGDTKEKEDNSLYNYEVYNCDLSCELAILSACETGKPSYQPGEGMVSMAHAFNYAGSKSILTSLWKIDEEMSTEIIRSFTENLDAGLRKDEALQQAKIDFLKTARGRTLSPQYWSGLILIGQTNAIELEKSPNPWIFWLLGGVVLIIIAARIYRRRSRP